MKSKLGAENVHRLMLKLSAPAVVAMVASGAYTTLSTIMISRGISMEAVGAVGIVFALQTLFHGFAQLVSIGAASAISRSLGKDNKDYASLVATNSYLLTTLISALLILGVTLFTEPLLHFFGADEALLEPALEYLTILKWTIPLNAIILLTSAIFRAEGNLKRSAIVVVIDAVLNIAFDYLFIFPLSLGLRGAGFATLASQTIASIFGLSFIWRQKSIISFHLKDLLPNFKVLWSVIKVGFSAFARNASTTAFSLVINNTLRSIGGTQSLIAFGAANRIVSLFFLPIMGVNQGFQPIASFNYGANSPDRVRQSIKYALIYTSIIGVIASLVGLLIPKQIIGLLTSDQEAIDLAATILRLQLILFCTVGFQTVASTLYQALGRGGPALFFSIFKQLLLMIPLILWLPHLGGLDTLGVWLSFPIAEGVAFLIVLFVLKRQFSLLKKAPIPTG